MKKILVTSLLISLNFSGLVYANPVVKTTQTSNQKEISVDKAKKALNDKNYVFIDVREKEEYDEAHIKGVNLIPLGNIKSGALNLDKKQKYITVCRSGKRSKMAAEEMKKLGLNVVNMTGGMNEWQAKGYPVIKEGK